MQLVVAQFDFGQRDFAGTGGRVSAPRIDVDLPRIAGSERLQIEDGSSAGIKKEAAIHSRNLHGNDGKNVTAFNGDFVFGVVGLGTKRIGQASSQQGENYKNGGRFHGIPILVGSILHLTSLLG